MPGGVLGAVELFVRLAEDLALHPRLLDLAADDTEILALELLRLTAAPDADNLGDVNGEKVLKKLVKRVVRVAASGMLDGKVRCEEEKANFFINDQTARP